MVSLEVVEELAVAVPLTGSLHHFLHGLALENLDDDVDLKNQFETFIELKSTNSALEVLHLPQYLVPSLLELLRTLAVRVRLHDGVHHVRAQQQLSVRVQHRLLIVNLENTFVIIKNKKITKLPCEAR